ncbi:MAG: adenylate/guanylate cyclase domain-containing protein, partial [Planctomycetota bacterium]
DAPDEGDADAVAAVNTACAMSIAFADLVERWTPRWQKRMPDDITIGLGCGIHTGEALVGNIGTELRKEYTALGPHVNFAQRLVMTAESGDIIVSASTKTMVRNKFHLTPKGVLRDVRNIPGAFKIWKVEGKK